MREIEFRAWDKRKNEMYYNWGYDSGLGGCFWLKMFSHVSEVEAKENGYNLPNSADWHNSIIFMQYTGLKDKNGTKIFEGDIIVLSNDKVKGEIIFNEKLSAFQLRYLGELRELFDPKFLGEWIACYGIIGNIHNNPELLEER